MTESKNNLGESIAKNWSKIERVFEWFNPNQEEIAQRREDEASANETELNEKPATNNQATTQASENLTPIQNTNPSETQAHIQNSVAENVNPIQNPAPVTPQNNPPVTPAPVSEIKNSQTLNTSSNSTNSPLSQPEEKSKLPEKTQEDLKSLKKNLESKPTSKLNKLSFSLRILRLSNKQKLNFYSELQTLIESGVTLIDSLFIMQAQTKNKSIKKLFDFMIHQINSGMSLSETLSFFPKIFPSVQSALIEAGEKSGNLKRVLAQIVSDMEGQQEFVRKIKGAMFYPVVLIVLALSMVAGMMIFVIPRVAELYEQSNAQLPTLTAVVIDISNFVAKNYLPLFGGITLGITLIVFFIQYTRIGRLMWEIINRNIPVFGKIHRQKNIMVFAANLGMLLESGVLINEAFKITEKTIGNLHFEKELKKIGQGLILGKNISEMMGLEDIRTQKFKRNPIFPLQVAQMIHIGELTGNIDKMMIKIRDTYKKNINFTLKNISALIEPLMIFIVALLVGSILLAVMLPFFYIGSTIN